MWRRWIDDFHAEHGNLWRPFVNFAALQTAYFVACVVNIRALAHLQYGWAVLTDGLICLMTWTIVKKIGEANNLASRIGYVVGGMIGSLLGMWITSIWG